MDRQATFMTHGARGEEEIGLPTALQMFVQRKMSCDQVLPLIEDVP